MTEDSAGPTVPGGATVPAAAAELTDRVWTIPNVLSVLRLIGIPVFLWLLLGIGNEAWALVVLMVAGATDWLDGKLARILNQQTRLGALLDPAADRLYMIVIPIALGLHGTLPWPVIGLLLAREAVLAGTWPLLRSRGLTALPVLYLGKAATMALMYAMPMLLAGALDNWLGTVFHPLGWAFLIWGLGMYWWTAVLYWYQTVLVMRTVPRVG